jgi:hypothetical protein
VEPQAGKHFTIPTANRSAGQFAQAVCRVAEHYPEAQTIHLGMDNLNIHACKSLTGFYGEQPGSALWNRFTVHYTPKHGSWVNQAEIEIGLFSRQCLGKRRIPDRPTLRSENRAWNLRTNRAGVTINWKFDREAARKKFSYTSNSFTSSEY